MSSATFRKYQDIVMGSVPESDDQLAQLAGCVLGLEEASNDACDMVDDFCDGTKPIDLPQVREQLAYILWCLTALTGVFGLTLEDLVFKGIVEASKEEMPS